MVVRGSVYITVNQWVSLREKKNDWRKERNGTCRGEGEKII